MADDGELNETISFMVSGFPIAKDFPEEWKEILDLPYIKPSPLREEGVPTEALTIRLGEVVYRYRRRLASENYYEEINASLELMRTASESIGAIVDRLAKLDFEHMEALAFVAAEISASGDKPGHSEHMFSRLNRARRDLEIYGAALTLVTAQNPAMKKLGRKLLPYSLPTAELIDVWQDLTGHKMSSPKSRRPDGGTKAGPAHATQPSTQFIYLALKMINRNATLSNAVSSIRRAIAMRERTQKIADSVPGGTNRFREIIRATLDI